MRLFTPSRLASAEEPGTQDAPARLFAIFLLAFTITALPVFLHMFGQPLALAVCVALSLAVALTLPGQAAIVVLTANIFQNLFVSMASVYYAQNDDVQPMKIYAFATTMVIWLVVMTKFMRGRQNFSPFVRRMMLASNIILAIYAVYFVAGLAVNPRNAIVYLRNNALPIILFQLFIVVGAKHFQPLPKIVSILIVMLAIGGYLELFATDFWLDLTNGWHYFSLLYADRLTNPLELKTAAQSGLVVTGLLDYSRTEFFNTPLFAGLDLKMQRLQGPNMHPISFGYLLAALLAFAAVHKRVALALLILPLLIATNAKGPLMLAVFCVIFHEAARRRDDGLALKGLLLALACFAVFAFRSGLSNGDYHVLGLLGGVNGFLKNPLGHTLGEGGNLSVADFASINWSKYQHEGAADMAVESGVGVMLFQLGVAAAAAFAFYFWIVRTSWRLYAHTRAPALAFAASAVATTLVNGLFQEEAYFSPLALGLVMGLAGLSLGAADRALAPRNAARLENAFRLRSFGATPAAATRR